MQLWDKNGERENIEKIENAFDLIIIVCYQ